MTADKIPIPMTRDEVIRTWFMEHRAKLIDIAAYLDRIDRATSDSGDVDFRDVAMRQAIGILTDGQPERARRILSLFSDPTADLPQSAEGMKGALGAVALSDREGSPA